MWVRKMLFLFLSILFLYNFSFAQGMASGEAVNYFNQGVRWQRDGDLRAARAAYDKARLTDPNNLNLRKFILNNTGVMYLKQRELKKAEEAFRAALNIDPNYKPAQFNLGLVYDLQGDRLKALEYWVKIFKIKIEEQKPKDFILEEEQKTE
jgi:tetratricopeptide (TPR) repeat protein